MRKRTRLTWPGLTGVVLILGSLLFQGSAWGPLTALTDSSGTFVYALPPRGLLGVVFHHQALWSWTNVLFMVGGLLTLLGLALLTRLLQEFGDRIFSQLGLRLFSFGTFLWCFQLAFRLSVDVWAAQELVSTGVVPDVYTPLALWTGVLFVIYTILALSALALFGGSILTARVLPRWVGWLALAYGVIGLFILGITGDAPPFLHYLLPLLMGILLLRRSQPALWSNLQEETRNVSSRPAP